MDPFIGHLGAIRLLLLQNKLEVDAKNVFGFTPLMKAAIQGHTRCAKALLFAGKNKSFVLFISKVTISNFSCVRSRCITIRSRL